MFKEKIVDYSFVLYGLGIFVTLFLIFGQTLFSLVYFSSIIFASISIFILVNSNINEEQINSLNLKFRVLNIFFLLSFITFSYLLSLVCIYSMSMQGEYLYLESCIFLFSFLISSSTIFTFLKSEFNFIKDLMLLIFFVLVLYFSLNLSFLYIFESLDNISRPYLSIIAFLGVIIFLFHCARYLKNILEESELID